MLILNEDAVLLCEHQLGKVDIDPLQNLVTINGRRVLIEPDPEKRSIHGCPNLGATVKPCTSTRNVREGYSQWIRIDGRPICLDTVTGGTDGTPPGDSYHVRSAGQAFVEEKQ